MSTSDTATKRIVARQGDDEIHYLRFEWLGDGAGGNVYKAQRLPSDSSLGDSHPGADEVRLVAVKLARKLEWVERLDQEARFLYELEQQEPKALEHSNTTVYRIVRINSGPDPYVIRHPSGRTQKLIELEYLDGTTLQKWFDEDWSKRTDQEPEAVVDEVMRCATELCQALLQMRVWGDGGLVHRDIKPANVMRTSVGLRVFDFNVARADEMEPKTVYIGTPGYWAPEVLVESETGRAIYDVRADLFSVGVILWEIVHRRYFKRDVDMPKQQGMRRLAWPTQQVEAMPAPLADALGQLIPALVCDVNMRLESPELLASRLSDIRARLAKPVVPAASTPPGIGEIDMIELLFELRPSGMIAVVTDTTGRVPNQERQSYLRDRMQIDDRLESWLCDELERAAGSDRKQPVLFVLAGNAGDGKSHLLKRVLGGRLAKRPELLHQVRAISDATHSLSWMASQRERLNEFFAPFRDTNPIRDSRVHVIAMNTGMVIRFFEQEDPLTGLYQELQRQLGLRRAPAPAALPWRVEVINLDLRNLFAKHADAPSFAEGMLARLDPEKPTSIPAPKWGECKACPAFAHCPVAFNLRALRMETPRKAVLSTLERVALASGVHLSPRSLWAFFYRLLTGGIERYAEPGHEPAKPCDLVRERVGSRKGEWLLAGHFTELLFKQPDAEEPWPSLARHDPAFSPVMTLDHLHTSLSIKPELDNSDPIIKELGGNQQCVADLPLATLGSWFPKDDSSFKGRRRDAAVRRHALFHRPTFNSWFEFESAGDFDRLLQAYHVYSVTENPAALGRDDMVELGKLRELIQDVFLRGNGKRIAGQFYLRVSQPNVRSDSQLLVLADAAALKPVFEIRQILTRDIHIDAHRNRPSLLQLLGYRPRQITLGILGLRLTVDLELFRFLGRVRDGQQPSVRDLAQFQTLLFIGGRVGNNLASKGGGVHELYVWKAEQHELHRLSLGDFETPHLTRVSREP